jgi:RNA polymerase sigma-70 factor (ECF subfamily)
MDVRAVAAAALPTARPADPDAALVAAARDDPRRFLELYDRYFERVLGYVRLRIRDDATCEDVTSHVFTTALAQLSRFRGDGTFAGWLFRIAGNAVHDVQRRPPSEQLPEDLRSTDDDLDSRLLRRERTAALRRAVRSLTAEQQHLLALRYGADLSYDEIGAIVGAAAGTVRVRLHRLLNDLRKRYPDA